MHNNLVKIVQLLEIFNFKTCKSMKFYLKKPSFLFTSLENWQIISPNRQKLFCTSLLTKSSKPRLKSKTINIISNYFVAKFCCTVKLALYSGTHDSTAIPPFLADGLGWPCPVRSALKRTPVQDFNSVQFHIKLKYIILIMEKFRCKSLFFL